MSEETCPVCWRHDGEHSEKLHEQRRVLDNLPPATAKPCAECPWRRSAMPGHLGPHSAEEWVETAHGESPIACHMTIERDGQDWSELRQCAGAATFRTNVWKSPRHPKVARSDERDTETVFASDEEFITHHNDPKDFWREAAMAIKNGPNKDKAVEKVMWGMGDGVLDIAAKDRDKPIMLKSPVPNMSVDDLKIYRDVALAFPPETRNHENSWECHEMLKNHPQRHHIIKSKWTEESLAQYLSGMQAWDDTQAQALKDMIMTHAKTRVAGMPDEEKVQRVTNMILDMQRDGLLMPNPDGTLTVRGTRKELMKYGIDPEAYELHEEKPVFDWESVGGKDAFAGDLSDPEVLADLVPVKDSDGKITVFPRKVYNEYVAHARACGNDPGIEPLNPTEVAALQRRKDSAKIRLVTGFDHDAMDPIQSRSYEEILGDLERLDKMQAQVRAEGATLDARRDLLERFMDRPTGQQFATANELGWKAWIETRVGDRKYTKTFGQGPQSEFLAEALRGYAEETGAWSA